MIKRIIIGIAVVSVVAYGWYYVLTSQSYEMSRKAQELYDKGEYREAYDLADKALRMNRLNRQAINLRPKLMRIVEGEDMLAEATRLYEDAVNKALEGKVEEAKLQMSQAYTLADNMPGLSPSKPKAKELIKKIERDAATIMDRAPETQYQTAVKYIGEGKLIRAYEALSNISLESEKIKNKKSELAYQIGMQRYEAALAEEAPSAAIVQDGIYWFGNVDKSDSNYIDAAAKVEAMRQMRTR